MRLLSPALFLIALAFLGNPASAKNELPGPSFDCAQAKSEAESRICKSEPLKVRDWWLDLAFRDSLVLDPSHADALKSEQSRWLEKRDTLCDLPPEQLAERAFFCLVRGYDDRIKALESASIVPIWKNSSRDPNAALKALQPLQGPLARVYADILSHALAEGESIRDFSNFTTALAEHIGGSSGFWRQGPNPEVVVPCALVESFPRLLLVGSPYFGNAMDTQLPSLDCASDGSRLMPSAVARFLASNPFTDRGAYNHCGAREGTYFVSLAYSLARQELRLARFPDSYLSDDLGAWRDYSTTWPTNEAIARMDWSGGPGYPEAQQALAAYYTERFKLPPAQAATAAARALWDNRFIGDPLPGCDEE